MPANRWILIGPSVFRRAVAHSYWLTISRIRLSICVRQMVMNSRGPVFGTETIY